MDTVDFLVRVGYHPGAHKAVRAATRRRHRPRRHPRRRRQRTRPPTVTAACSPVNARAGPDRDVDGHGALIRTAMH